MIIEIIFRVRFSSRARGYATFPLNKPITVTSSPYRHRLLHDFPRQPTRPFPSCLQNHKRPDKFVVGAQSDGWFTPSPAEVALSFNLQCSGTVGQRNKGYWGFSNVHTSVVG